MNRYKIIIVPICLLRSKTDLDVLSRNVKIISEGVARHLYGLICEVRNKIMLQHVYLFMCNESHMGTVLVVGASVSEPLPSDPNVNFVCVCINLCLSWYCTYICVSWTGLIFASNVDDPYRIDTYPITFQCGSRSSKESSCFVNQLEKQSLSSSDTKKDTVPVINCVSTVGIHKVSVATAV